MKKKPTPASDSQRLQVVQDKRVNKARYNRDERNDSDDEHVLRHDEHKTALDTRPNTPQVDGRSPIDIDFHVAITIGNGGEVPNEPTMTRELRCSRWPGVKKHTHVSGLIRMAQDKKILTVS